MNDFELSLEICDLSLDATVPFGLSLVYAAAEQGASYKEKLLVPHSPLFVKFSALVSCESPGTLQNIQFISSFHAKTGSMVHTCISCGIFSATTHRGWLERYRWIASKESYCRRAGGERGVQLPRI